MKINKQLRRRAFGLTNEILFIYGSMFGGGILLMVILLLMDK
jgi:hypothetical protein